MQPITIHNPTPGKTTKRTLVKPQPPEGWKPLIIGKYHPTVIRKGEQQPGPEVYGAADDEWGCVAPHKLMELEQVGGEWWWVETRVIQVTKGSE